MKIYTAKETSDILATACAIQKTAESGERKASTMEEIILAAEKEGIKKEFVIESLLRYDPPIEKQEDDIDKIKAHLTVHAARKRRKEALNAYVIRLTEALRKTYPTLKFVQKERWYLISTGFTIYEEVDSALKKLCHIEVCDNLVIHSLFDQKMANACGSTINEFQKDEQFVHGKTTQYYLE
ncbi:hypothetical protein HY486_04390 [Candidatus Woesearchaeota archaeon]|nr:hypothetical protein [Candidatus Woesearchaeota archaeon]